MNEPQLPERVVKVFVSGGVVQNVTHPQDVSVIVYDYDGDELPDTDDDGVPCCRLEF